MPERSMRMEKSSKAIFVSSSEACSGKSAFCLGLGLILREKGLRIGYMKPVGNLPVQFDDGLVDDDVLHARNVFQLDDDLELMSPVLLTNSLIQMALRRGVNFSRKIARAYKKLTSGKDVMLLEGAGDLGGGAMINLSDTDVAKLLGTKILLISKYDSIYVVDRILSDMKIVGGSEFAGVILNDVPPEELEKTNNLIVPFLEGKGIEVLGVLPTDPLLKSVTVQELKEKLGARTLVEGDNFIESFVVGAMSMNNAIRYFRKVSDKAVITGGDRADVLMAALQTPTRCLILTGNISPDEQVLAEAERLNVPVILVPQDTATTVHIAESLVNRIRATKGAKLERTKELILNNVDVERLYRVL